jgi:pSer/pThr/pTyr-binding forkhead associated (FHA) protein
VLEPPQKPPPAVSAEKDGPGIAPLLVVIHANPRPLLGRRYVLDHSPVLVGRGVENDIVIQDGSVSRRHAHLERRDAAWWCIDDSSTDGVYIDDRKATGRTPLACGTRIGIGSTIFKFLCGSQLEERYEEEIYRLTVCDGLTQAYRERYLIEALDKEIVRARRRGSRLALLMIEVDELEAIDRERGLLNDGDRVLGGRGPSSALSAA